MKKSLTLATLTFTATALMIGLVDQSARAQEPDSETSTTTGDVEVEDEEEKEEVTTTGAAVPDPGFSGGTGGGFPGVTGGFPGSTFPGTGIPPFPKFHNCSRFVHSFFPGDDGGSFPGHPGHYPPNGYESCGLQEFEPGRPTFSCRCADADSASAGELDPDWFTKRPSYPELEQGCQELLQAQCGTIKPLARVECETSLGYCEVSGTARTDGSVWTSVSNECYCRDGYSWSTRSKVNDELLLEPDLAEEVCRNEVSLCGLRQFGRGDTDILDAAATDSRTIAVSTPYGDCSLRAKAKGTSFLNVECHDETGTNLVGEFDWNDRRSNELIFECSERLLDCDPLGASGTTTTTGAANMSEEASVQVLTPGELQVQGPDHTATPAPYATADQPHACSLGQGEGSRGWWLMALVALGACRPRRRR